jgi:hypothetical protein
MSFVPSTCTGTPTGCGCGSPSPFAMPAKTSIEWAMSNPILSMGATAYESDTGKWKIGNGVDAYVDLPYQAEPGVAGPPGPAGPAGPAGAVGPAAPLYSLVIGSVTTGPVPLATITGTPPTQTLNLVLPSSGGGGTDTLTFVSSPSDQSVYVGDDVSLYANAQSTETPIAYMWQMTTDGGANWTDVAPGQSLKFKAVLADNGKTYRCKASTATLGPAYSLLSELTVQPSVIGSTWRDASNAAPPLIKFYDGQFAGYGGRMSADGLTWSGIDTLDTVPSFGSGTWTGIDMARYGEATPCTSPDGINWTPRDAIQTNYWGSRFVWPLGWVCYSFGKTQGSPTAGNVIPYWSADGGATWQKGVTSGLASTEGPSGSAYDLAYVNGAASSITLSVAVGSGFFRNSTSTTLRYTTNKCIRAADPKGWVGTTLPFTAVWNDVAYANGRFVAVCDGPNAATSTDGINWTVIRMPATLNWTGIAFGNGTWVAVGGPSSISAISADGINWTKVTLPKSANWTSVAYGNGQFLMTSSTGVSLYSK